MYPSASSWDFGNLKRSIVSTPLKDRLCILVACQGSAVEELDVVDIVPLKAAKECELGSQAPTRILLRFPLKLPT